METLLIWGQHRWMKFLNDYDFGLHYHLWESKRYCKCFEWKIYARIHDESEI